eukprot:CAMPEP_0177608208 /NCGR_PEP_ID=MMETSP0419_2-20121207/18341_1 /TAXON_ID=582737 /ORGANISM="Tetraselmis sp., Strain GSL018" /LENGTH=125 /DNA_ID=CAMNT_0019102867 /DNA_START=369 /DNA_END=744 /DNA_ORIENTATION=-
MAEAEDVVAASEFQDQNQGLSSSPSEAAPRRDAVDPCGPQSTFRFSVRVCARFRPTTDSTRNGPSHQTVVLPLHQRLQMVKARFPGGLSTRAAAGILMEEMGRCPKGGWWDAGARGRSAAGGDSA